MDHGDPPIPNMLSNYLEILWGFPVSAIEVSQERGRYELGGENAIEEPQQAGSPRENFGDTSVLVEEIH